MHEYVLFVMRAEYGVFREEGRVTIPHLSLPQFTQKHDAKLTPEQVATLLSVAAESVLSPKVKMDLTKLEVQVTEPTAST